MKKCNRKKKGYKSVDERITSHKVIFGDCRNMKEVDSGEVHLMVTSPPYYNAPFDYPGLFKSYDEYLDLIKSLAGELRRVLAEGE